MTTLTDADRKLLCKQLSYAHAWVDLDCDGYAVSIRAFQIRPLKYGLLICIGGEFKGTWLLQDCEERRRFMRPICRYLFKKSIRTTPSHRRLLGRDKIDCKFVRYDAVWLSPRAMLRHFERNNKIIKIIPQDES